MLKNMINIFQSQKTLVGGKSICMGSCCDIPATWLLIGTGWRPKYLLKKKCSLHYFFFDAVRNHKTK